MTEHYNCQDCEVHYWTVNCLDSQHNVPTFMNNVRALEKVGGDAWALMDGCHLTVSVVTV